VIVAIQGRPLAFGAQTDQSFCAVKQATDIWSQSPQQKDFSDYAV
jgi:hypothetical protein